MGMKPREPKMKPVVICTEKRGVFFGYLPANIHPETLIGKPVTLKNAQMAVYWSASTKGVLGLASAGPDATCRIGDPVTSITDGPVHAIIDCTAEAAVAWKKCPWG